MKRLVSLILCLCLTVALGAPACAEEAFDMSVLRDNKYLKIDVNTEDGIASFASPIRDAYTVTGGSIATSLVSPAGSAQSAPPVPATTAAISLAFIFSLSPSCEGT